jgi:hypothetical protein
MSDTTAPGLYVVNATGEMVPVHTADGGDQQVLREYLQEWDLPGIEVTDDD